MDWKAIRRTHAGKYFGRVDPLGNPIHKTGHKRRAKLKRQNVRIGRNARRNR